MLLYRPDINPSRKNIIFPLPHLLFSTLQNFSAKPQKTLF